MESNSCSCEVPILYSFSLSLTDVPINEPGLSDLVSKCCRCQKWLETNVCCGCGGTILGQHAKNLEKAGISIACSKCLRICRNCFKRFMPGKDVDDPDSSYCGFVCEEAMIKIDMELQMIGGRNGCSLITDAEKMAIANEANRVSKKCLAHQEMLKKFFPAEYREIDSLSPDLQRKIQQIEEYVYQAQMDYMRKAYPQSPEEIEESRAAADKYLNKLNEMNEDEREEDVEFFDGDDDNDY